jgi:hypothetical protein
MSPTEWWSRRAMPTVRGHPRRRRRPPRTDHQEDLVIRYGATTLGEPNLGPRGNRRQRKHCGCIAGSRGSWHGSCRWGLPSLLVRARPSRPGASTHRRDGSPLAYRLRHREARGAAGGVSRTGEQSARRQRLPRPRRDHPRVACRMDQSNALSRPALRRFEGRVGGAAGTNEARARRSARGFASSLGHRPLLRASNIRVSPGKNVVSEPSNGAFSRRSTQPFSERVGG